MHYATLFALAVHVGLIALTPGSSLLAQRPGMPRDSARRDSLARDSLPRDSLASDSTCVRPMHHPLMYLIPVAGAAAAVVGGAALAFAPAPLAMWPRRPDHASMKFLEGHRASDVAIGGIFREGETWAYSANFEIVRGPLLAQLALEDFRRREPVQHFTARGGYLFHPQRGTAGGLTIGYRHARRGRLQSGVEVGLPFLVGDSTGTWRFEPTYVLSGNGALWSYRLQYDRYFTGQRYFLGLRFVGKSVPLNSGHPLYQEEPAEYFARAVTLLVGRRF
jgi:hypothetical protein